jgi:hypothetical protein
MKIINSPMGFMNSKFGCSKCHRETGFWPFKFGHLDSMDYRR